MPPDNSGFMVAAYVVTAVIVLAYAVSLLVRLRRHRSRHESMP